MQSIAEAVVGGCNAFFSEQRAVAGTAKVTFVQFDDREPHEVLLDDVDLASVVPLGVHEFIPRGNTPLLDATALLLDRAEARGGAPTDNLVVVFTDGEENASRRWDRSRLFRRISDLQDRGWTFVFLGANQDSYAEGGALGFATGSTSNFAATACERRRCLRRAQPRHPRVAGEVGSAAHARQGALLGRPQGGGGVRATDRRGMSHPRGTTGCEEEGDMARALHLVDIDNLLGNPATDDEDEIGWTIRTYQRVASVRPGDHVVVATSPFGRHALAIGTAWPGVGHVWRKGTDGADMALLEEAEWAVETGAFTRVVIGSGDRIFLVALELFEGIGVPVEVVSRRRSAARALCTRARSVTFLPERAAA